MNKHTFIKLISDPTQITDSDLAELEKVVENFPYCQTAHILIAKASNDLGSMLSAQKLQKAAAYTADRKNLKYLIHLQPIPVKKAEPQQEEKSKESTAVSETIDTALTKPVTTPSVDLPKESPQEESTATTNTSGISPSEPLIENQGTQPPYSAPSESKSEEKAVNPEEKIDQKPEAKPNFFEELERNLQRLKELREKNNSENNNNSESTESSPEKKTLNSFTDLPIIPVKEEKIQQEITPPVTDKPYFAISEELPLKALKQDIATNTPSSETPSNNTRPVIAKVDKEVMRDDADLYLEYLNYLNTKRARHKRNKEKEEALIKKFIQEEPSIPYLRVDQLPEEQEDLSAKSTKITKKPASENFAKILILQKKYDKAIEIYEELILKYPEKTTYFAEKIEELKHKNKL